MDHACTAGTVRKRTVLTSCGIQSRIPYRLQPNNARDSTHGIQQGLRMSTGIAGTHVSDRKIHQSVIYLLYVPGKLLLITTMTALACVLILEYDTYVHNQVNVKCCMKKAMLLGGKGCSSVLHLISQSQSPDNYHPHFYLGLVSDIPLPA